MLASIIVRPEQIGSLRKPEKPPSIVRVATYTRVKSFPRISTLPDYLILLRIPGLVRPEKATADIGVGMVPWTFPQLALADLEAN
jgi:hypothetical protein